MFKNTFLDYSSSLLLKNITRGHSILNIAADDMDTDDVDNDVDDSTFNKVIPNKVIPNKVIIREVTPNFEEDSGETSSGDDFSTGIETPKGNVDKFYGVDFSKIGKKSDSEIDDATNTIDVENSFDTDQLSIDIDYDTENYDDLLYPTNSKTVVRRATTFFKKLNFLNVDEIMYPVEECTTKCYWSNTFFQSNLYNYYNIFGLYNLLTTKFYRFNNIKFRKNFKVAFSFKNYGNNFTKLRSGAPTFVKQKYSPVFADVQPAQHDNVFFDINNFLLSFFDTCKSFVYRHFFFKTRFVYSTASVYLSALFLFLPDNYILFFLNSFFKNFRDFLKIHQNYFPYLSFKMFFVSNEVEKRKVFQKFDLYLYFVLRVAEFKLKKKFFFFIQNVRFPKLGFFGSLAEALFFEYKSYSFFIGKNFLLIEIIEVL